MSTMSRPTPSAMSTEGFINLSLFEPIERTNLLQTIRRSSYYSLLFKSAPRFLLISLEMHKVFLVLYDRSLKLTFWDSLHPR